MKTRRWVLLGEFRDKKVICVIWNEWGFGVLVSSCTGVEATRFQKRVIGVFVVFQAWIRFVLEWILVFFFLGGMSCGMLRGCSIDGRHVGRQGRRGME